VAAAWTTLTRCIWWIFPVKSLGLHAGSLTCLPPTWGRFLFSEPLFKDAKSAYDDVSYMTPGSTRSNQSGVVLSDHPCICGKFELFLMQLLNRVSHRSHVGVKMLSSLPWFPRDITLHGQLWSYASSESLPGRIAGLICRVLDYCVSPTWGKDLGSAWLSRLPSLLMMMCHTWLQVQPGQIRGGHSLRPSMYLW